MFYRWPPLEIFGESECTIIGFLRCRCQLINHIYTFPYINASHAYVLVPGAKQGISPTRFYKIKDYISVAE